MTRKRPTPHPSALLFSTAPMQCQVCGQDVPVNTVHQCGDPLAGKSELAKTLATLWAHRAGSITSPAKARSSKKNAKLGGRPKGAKDTKPRKKRGPRKKKSNA